MRVVVLLLVLSCAWACRNFLDVEIDDQLSNEEILTDLDNANLAAVGLYNHLGDIGLYGEFLIMYPELMAGHLQPSPDRSVTTNLIDAYLNTYQFMTQVDESRISNVYEKHYEGIMAASRLIEAMPRIEDSREELIDAIEGEARTIRALLYFQLLQIYAQDYQFTAAADHLAVPYYDQPLGVFERRARASVAEVYEQIEADLETAIALVNQQNIRASDAQFWVRPGIPEGLLSRVYLFQGKWQSALNMADAALSLANYQLLSPDQYLANWSEARYEETLWLLDQSYRQATGLNAIFGAGDSTRAQTFVVSPDLFARYESTDARVGLYEQTQDGLIFSRKYIFQGNTTRPKSLLRASELLLNKAEALAQLDRLPEAADALGVVLAQSIENPTIAADNREELLDRIAEERKKELALEGFGFWDIRRRQESVVRPSCRENAFENCDQLYPSEKFVLPIPQNAIIANPLLEQNPGY